MSSSDDDTTAPWVSIAKQPDWQDLEPIEQPVSLSPVVAIKYTTQVKELYSYFRAIRAAVADTRSELHLCEMQHQAWHCWL